ncbi:hypothetical protein MLIT_28970 [Mycolicibacterium litorale]|uniref:Uncharacterized protein n=1 Tax=Mycolicibacterium litorale TaxID=758802 RepID=A0AAD1IKC5_9MYCO|nr:hypothetical protein MLIT_28970 [Mycolicibacterium litorale]
MVDSGPIMFQAQKLIAETHVASARFTPRRAPVSGVVAVLTHTREPPVGGTHMELRKTSAAKDGGRAVSADSAGTST